VATTSERQTDRNTRLVLRFLDLVDRQQFDEVEAMLAPGFQIHFSGVQLDRAQMMDMVRAIYASFNDLVHDVQETFAAGDRVVVRAILRGTHTGEFEGIAATGRPITLGQLAIARVEGDQLTEFREEVDTLVLMQQIGAWPPPAS
jgi:predicted ester cyclase